MLLKPARVNDLQSEDSIKSEMVRNCKKSTTAHQPEKQSKIETTIKSHKKNRESQYLHRTNPIRTNAIKRRSNPEQIGRQARNSETAL